MQGGHIALAFVVMMSWLLVQEQSRSKSFYSVLARAKDAHSCTGAVFGQYFVLAFCAHTYVHSHWRKMMERPIQWVTTRLV